MSGNFYSVCQQRMGTGPFIRDASGADLYNYEDLEFYSARYANHFKELGAQKGDRVLVQVEKSPHNLFIYFACLRSGFVYLPLNTAYQYGELTYFVSDATPALIICDPANESCFKAINGDASSSAAQILTMDKDGKGTVNGDIMRFADTADTVWCDADDTAVILYTSGTTGKPKGAMITHGNLTSNALSLLKTWQWIDSDILLHALPVFHIHGLFVATHLPVLNASPIIFLDKFDADSVIDCLPCSTVYMGVPTHYVRLLDRPSLNSSLCRSMRLFTCGSAPLLPQTFLEFKQRTNHIIVERYGMTETGMNTSNPLNGERKAGTVGLPLEGISVKIINEENQSVTVGETGQLLVKGPNVFKGYWNKPTKTKEEFTNEGYFRTGDLASQDKEGYISIVGRNKDMIITGGLNVYPRELEYVIDEMDEVGESAVIGIPDKDFGEAVIAIIAGADPSLSEQAVIANMKSRLANFKVAKQVFFVEELPRNTMGKIQKNLLREQFSKG